MSNSIFNINEPLVYGIPIVLSPIYAIPFIIVPCILFLTTYLAMFTGLVPPIIKGVSWTTPVFISGYISTGSMKGVLLQLFNLILATMIYTPFVRLSGLFTEIRLKAAYQELVDYITSDYIASSHDVLNRRDEMGVVARQLAKHLLGAMKNGEMFLHYQPIVNVKTHKMCGVEALLRWKHSTYGMIHPMLIISLAEEIRLIDKLGFWIIEQAMIQRAVWNENGVSDYYISVNVSSCQLEVPDFYCKILHILDCLKISHHQLQIEITETIALTESPSTYHNLIKLADANIHIVMDDFGAGHSSLLYLSKVPIHVLKIDASLSREIVESPINLNIISTIYDLCQLMHINIVVEYVENQEQLKKLMQIGDFLVQGYLFSPPLQEDKIPQFISELEDQMIRIKTGKD